MAKKRERARDASPRRSSGKTETKVERQRESADRSPAEAESPLPVVGICSSAGGLKALNRLLRAMPADSGTALVLVPHLDPSHESLMVELLSKQTDLPVQKAKEGARLRPNNVYVIPPNSALAIEKGRLRLSAPTEPRGARTVIDEFLRSLARDQGERAIGIVLSGTGSHGAVGIREIKFAGGMTMAQEPESAEYDSMPRAAIATGAVDRVLPPEEMPAALVEFARHPYLRGGAAGEDTPRDVLNRILALVRARTRYDFRCYRKNMLLRRIQRRMGLRRVEGLADYHRLLREDAGEVTALYKDLLIGVTAFFREAEAFQVVEQRVVRELVERCSDESPVRVWVPACATGEEAYSIGMLLLEAFSEAEKPPSIQIFATDIDEDALEVARAGRYPESISADVSDARLRRFFLRPNQDGYQVAKQLREPIVFAQQNLISDAPFSQMDLVSCRNLLIYLEPELQAKVLGLLHFSLREGGYLFLGPSESVGHQAGIFAPVSKKWRVFRRVGPTRHDLFALPALDRRTQEGLEENGGTTAATEKRRVTARLNEVVNRMLLSAYAPASVLIDRSHQILFYHGTMTDYLEMPTGEPSVDLLAMARPGLRTRIRTVVERALDERRTVVDAGARVKRDGRYVSCAVTARPVSEPRDLAGLVLVTFRDVEEPAAVEPRETAAPAAEESSVFEQLERELRATQEDLQGTIEELESSNEELTASNEEIMSMNEELQSTNEELETSKEELQSMNEELNTVNSELQSKVNELETTNDDVTNLLNATNVATLFLDAEMRIKRFTPPTARLLSLVPADVGRPVADFSLKIIDGDLVADAERVVRELAPVDKEVWTADAPRSCYLRRILPYLTAERRIDGVVVTFHDVTSNKLAEQEREKLLRDRSSRLDDYQEQLESIVDTSEDGIITIDSEGTIDVFNPAAERIFGYQRSEVVGLNVKVLMPRDVASEHDDHVARYLETGEARIIGIGREVEGRRKDGTLVPLELRIGAYAKGHFTGFLRDLTARKRLEAEYLHAQKMEAIGRLAGGVAHDFNNLLAGVLGGLRLAMKSMPPEHPALPLLREVCEELARGAAITRRLLDFSRTAPPEPRPLDPHETILGAEQMMRRLVGEDVELIIDCDAPETLIRADAGLIEQALLNLVINARDAMPDGGKLAIDCHLVDLAPEDLERMGGTGEAGPYFVLSIADTGCGMDAETVRRAREAFFTTKESGTGTGLGLSMVDSMMQACGGGLELSSAVDEGTRVNLYFPLVEAAEGAAPEGLAPQPAVASDGRTGNGETVLVVEDAKLVRLGVQGILEELGYVVRTATNPEEALAELRADGSDVDLLLTDVVMPGMSGPDLVKVVRGIRPDLPYLFMSAFPQAELVARGRIEPGVPTLEKPFGRGDVAARVAEALALGPPKPA